MQQSPQRTEVLVVWSSARYIVSPGSCVYESSTPMRRVRLHLAPQGVTGDTEVIGVCTVSASSTVSSTWPLVRPSSMLSILA